MARTWTAWIFTSSAQNKSPLQLKVPRRRRFKNVQFSFWSKVEQCRVDLKLNKRKKKRKTYKKSVLEVDAFFANLEGDQNVAVARWSQRAALNTRSSLTWGTLSISLCDIIRGAEVQTCDDRGKMGLFSDSWVSSPTGWTHIG